VIPYGASSILIISARSAQQEEDIIHEASESRRPRATGSLTAPWPFVEPPATYDDPGKSAPSGSPQNQVGWPLSGSGSRRGVSSFEPIPEKIGMTEKICSGVRSEDFMCSRTSSTKNVSKRVLPTVVVQSPSRSASTWRRWLMISGAPALCVCVVHRNILIDYSSMDASVPHVRGQPRCRHRHQDRAIPILPAEAVGG
jgi:hypothetical protein